MKLGVVMVIPRGGGAIRSSKVMAMSEAQVEYRATKADPGDRIMLGAVRKAKSKTVSSLVDPVADNAQEVEPVMTETTQPKRKYTRKSE